MGVEGSGVQNFEVPVLEYDFRRDPSTEVASTFRPP